MSWTERRSLKNRGPFPFAELPPVQPPVDVSDEALFPEFAAARRHMEEMRVNDPKQYAALQAEWAR